MNIQSLTAPDLAAWLADDSRPDPLLLDVREPWEFATCHLDGAQPIPLGVHQAALAQEGAMVTLSNSGAGKLTLLGFRVTAARSAG